MSWSKIRLPSLSWLVLVFFKVLHPHLLPHHWGTLLLVSENNPHLVTLRSNNIAAVYICGCCVCVYRVKLLLVKYFNWMSKQNGLGWHVWEFLCYQFLTFYLQGRKRKLLNLFNSCKSYARVKRSQVLGHL